MAGNWQWLIVGGCPRSGTTMLNFVFNDHPRIRLTNENDLGALLVQLKTVFYREQLIARLPARRLGKSESWHREDVRNATLRSSRSLLPMLRALYEANFSDQVEIEKMQYFGDKFPTYYLDGFNTVKSLLSPLTIIHVSRNPLAVINSMLRRSKNTRRGEDIWKGGTSVSDCCMEWAQAWNFVNDLQDEAGSSGLKLLHLKFEDLVSDPERSFTDIQGFLQIETPFDISRILENPEPDLDMISTQNRQEIIRLLPGVVESWERPLAEIRSTIGILPTPRGRPHSPMQLVGASKYVRNGSQLLKRLTNGILRKAGYELRRYSNHDQTTGSPGPLESSPAGNAQPTNRSTVGKHIDGRDEILEYFMREYRFDTVLDIGCGPGAALHILTASGRNVTGIDILSDTEVSLPPGNDSARYVQQDFMEYNTNEKFDAIVSSHVIEHMPDTERFLKKYFSFLKESGVYCLIWPPLKQSVVGGHVHIFNMGLMLYNLVRTGIDCSDVDMLRCGYSQAVIGRLRRFELPVLKHDEGDIESLSRYFPFPATQDFDGDNVPGMIDLPRQVE